MAGINAGILSNATPLSTAKIVDLEKRVLESKNAYVYLDENSKLCFALPTPPMASKTWRGIMLMN